MTLGLLIGAVSLGVIAAVVALAVLANRWPRLGRWFAEDKGIEFRPLRPSDEQEKWVAVREHMRRELLGRRGEMSGAWKRDNRIGWRDGDK